MLDEFFRMITDWSRTGDFFTTGSWFHLMWLAFILVVTLFVCRVYARRHDKAVDDSVVFFFGALLLVSEVYKQFFWLIKLEWRYDFGNLPFQFCDVPSWVMFIAPLCKEGKVKDALYKFLAFYGLLAGIAVMSYPDGCMTTNYITMLVHTMLWHSTMVIVGIYVIIAKGYGVNYKKELLPGLCTYSFFFTIALVLNETVGRKVNGYFNLFYISSRYGSTLPVLSLVYDGSQPMWRWHLLLAMYLLAFGLGASLLFFITKGIRSLIARGKKGGKKVQTAK